MCSKIGSGATPRGGGDVYLDAGPYALIRSQNVYNDGFHREGLAYIGEDHAAQLANVEVSVNDVLLNITGDSVARACQVDPGVLPARVNQHVAIIRPDPDVLDPRFLRYFLVSPEMQSKLLSWAGSGGTRNALTKGMIESFDVPAPEDIDEQRAIAHILGTLDDKIELNRRMSETLEAMARALFKSWFVDFDPVRAKAEGRDPGLPDAIADLFPNALTEHPDLGQIPEGWDPSPLSDCTDVARGLSYKGSGLSDDGVPMHNLNSIYEGGGYKFEGLKRYSGAYRPQHVARAGDLIVANTEQGHHRLLIGYAAIVPTCFEDDSLFSHHIYRVRVRSDSALTADYLCHLLNTPVMHDTVSGYANGTTVNMLPMDGLQSPLVVVPPSRAVAAFTNVAERARRRRERMVEESRTLAALRDALLPELISGDLRLDDPERILGRAG
ncbi:MAG: restriction endonuclease subunit S [Trueperaceae bacterium]|nr:restriction endonuclease subunit S [Trueperaceae bacterium]